MNPAGAVAIVTFVFVFLAVLVIGEPWVNKGKIDNW